MRASANDSFPVFAYRLKSGKKVRGKKRSPANMGEIERCIL